MTHKSYTVYDKITISRNHMIKDSEYKDKLKLKIYLRRKSDMEWLEANASLPKSFIKEIRGVK